MLEAAKKLKKGDIIVEYFAGLEVEATIISDVVLNSDNLVEFTARLSDGKEIEYVVGHPMGPKVYLHSDYYRYQ